MALTNKQKMLLHLAAKEAGVDEAQRRVIQQTVGGFYSAADATASHAGFAAVMAFYEDRSGGRLDRYTARYWREAAAKADTAHGDTSRLIWRIDSEAKKLGWTRDQVNSFLMGKHMSSGQYGDIASAPVYWLTRVVEAMKEINKRAAVFAGGGPSREFRRAGRTLNRAAHSAPPRALPKDPGGLLPIGYAAGRPEGSGIGSGNGNEIDDVPF